MNTKATIFAAAVVASIALAATPANAALDTTVNMRTFVNAGAQVDLGEGIGVYDPGTPDYCAALTGALYVPVLLVNIYYLTARMAVQNDVLETIVPIDGLDQPLPPPLNDCAALLPPAQEVAFDDVVVQAGMTLEGAVIATNINAAPANTDNMAVIANTVAYDVAFCAAATITGPTPNPILGVDDLPDVGRDIACAAGWVAGANYNALLAGAGTGPEIDITFDPIFAINNLGLANDLNAPNGVATYVCVKFDADFVNLVDGTQDTAAQDQDWVLVLDDDMAPADLVAAAVAGLNTNTWADLTPDQTNC